MMAGSTDKAGLAITRLSVSTHTHTHTHTHTCQKTVKSLAGDLHVAVCNRTSLTFHV